MRKSKYVDTKDYFQRELKEHAFNEAYNKDIKLSFSYTAPQQLFKSFNEVSEYTVRFSTKDGKFYTITEFMEDGATKYCILGYQDRKYQERIFDKFYQAEEKLVEMLENN